MTAGDASTPEFDHIDWWCMCGVVDDRRDGTCGNCDRSIMPDDACPCGCPDDMHIGEIGCPCALPGESPCVSTTPAGGEG